MQKRYFWLKFKTDFFQNPIIKKMRRVSGGDTFVIIYLKLQLLSVPEGGFVKLTGIEENYWEELSLLLDEEKDDVQVTCMYLTQYGLLEVLDEHTLYLPDASENIGSEGDSARRMRKLRERKAQQISAPTSQCDTAIASQCDNGKLLPDGNAQASQCDNTNEENEVKTSQCDENHANFFETSQCDDRERERYRYRYRYQSESEEPDKLGLTSDFDKESEDNFFVFCIVAAFTKLFGREPNKSFVTSINKLSKSGLQVGDAQEAILKAARKKPRNPEPYILTIFKELLQKTQKQQEPNPDMPLADWELQWMEEVKRRRAAQDALESVKND